jgi:translation initiation factor IF-2
MQERYKYLAETAGWSAEAIKTYFKNAGYEIDIVDGKINNVSYFDTSKLLLDDKEIKESAEELAKARAEEAKAARDRARSLENEIDYYRTINELIDDLSKEMDKLSKKKD